LVSNQGNVFSFGDNEHGELGLGHFNETINPELVKSLKNFKISQISCGFKHVICRTTLGKVFTWGWNEFGQLSTGGFND
jgi:alpha-tubulin suppressor-like RCC1 family protein